MYVHACAHTRAREIVCIFIHLSIHLSKWIIYLSMYLSIYIHIASYINVCIRMRAHARERDSVYIHTSIYLSIYIHSDIYPSIYLYTCMQIHIWMYAHACTRTHAKEIVCVWKQNHSMKRLAFFLSCECSMPHMWMSHVTHMSESCHTWRSYVAHMNASFSRMKRLVFLLEEAGIFSFFLSCERSMPRIWMSDATHVNESCHTYEFVMPCMQMSHERGTCEWVMSHIWMSRWVMPHMWISHVTQVDVAIRL